MQLLNTSSFNSEVISNIRVPLLPGNAQVVTHSAGVYITVNSHSLDAHLLARLDHLIENKENTSQ